MSPRSWDWTRDSGGNRAYQSRGPSPFLWTTHFIIKSSRMVQHLVPATCAMNSNWFELKGLVLVTCPMKFCVSPRVHCSRDQSLRPKQKNKKQKSKKKKFKKKNQPIKIQIGLFPRPVPSSNLSGLKINARPLAQASVKAVERVQVTDHSPGLASTIITSRIYYSTY